MRAVRVLREAANEATEAAAYYEGARPGLGQQFEETVYDTLQLLKDDIVPLTSISPRLTAAGIRRLVMRRFPYSVIVRDVGDALEVIALAHSSRRPGYWRHRIVT